MQISNIVVAKEAGSLYYLTVNLDNSQSLY